MIKTLKEILVPIASNSMVLVPAGTYLVNKGLTQYSYEYPGLENYRIDGSEIEKYPDFFAEVPSDEPEMYEIIRLFSDLLDRQDMNDVISSIEKTDHETIARIRKFFGGDDVADLKRQIKELETKLFLAEMSKTVPYTQPIHPNPYTPIGVPNSNCAVCGIDFNKNTNYACMSSACPNRAFYFSTTSDKVTETNPNPAGTTVTYIYKKNEE